MVRDMELIRKILLHIEKKHLDVALFDIKIPEYDLKTVANHCKVLYEANLISNYNSQFADGGLYSFGVGGLTWEGHEFLDKIKQDNVWSKTKSTLIKKGIPATLEAIKEISTAIITGMIQNAINGQIG